MTLHKIVNGAKVELSADEESATLAEWDANDPAKQPKPKAALTADALAAKLIAKGVISKEDIDSAALVKAKGA